MMEAELMTSEVAVIPKAEMVTTMDRLLSAAQGGMDIAMIERFMSLAERQEKREAEKAFHRAFAAFKANPPEIVKSKLVDFTNSAGKRTRYKHAPIGAVVSAIIGGMSKHGLSHRWNVTQDGRNITVSCLITHEMGHTEVTTISAGADESGGKNAIQAIASTVTYLQRYTLQAATGIAVLEADDDGRGTEGITQPTPKGKKHDQKKDESTAPGRKAVEQWIEYIDQHVKLKENAAATLEIGWNTNVEPIISKFPAAHQNELKIAYSDTMRLLQEREAAK